MNDLEAKTGDVHHKKTPEERIDALLQAFELYCQETSRLEVAYGKLKEEFGAINHELGQANDKLNRKLLELKKLTQYLHSILDHISQGLLFIDSEGIITTFNPVAEHILGKKRAEVLRQKFQAVFSDTLFGFSVKEALAHKRAPSFTRLTLSTESPPQHKLLEIETQFLDGEIKGLMITLRDMTEINRLELISKQSDRLKELGEIASLVAHEIRNPLGGIKGFAALLKRDLDDRPEQAKMAAFIVDGANRLNEIVERILNYARNVAPHFTSVNISQLIGDVQKLIEHDAQISPQPSFGITITPPDLQATLDEKMIKGVLLNLFINAAQAMPNGGTIEVKACLKKNDLVLVIKDEGTGISKENLEKIFTHFFSTKISGNGFGLPEAYKVVQAHGGQIEVASELGKGATFTIKIPQKALVR